MRTVPVMVLDFCPGAKAPQRIFDLLKPRFNCIASQTSPYILHSCFGYEALKHNGVRIFTTGENVRADFNVSDYALDFDWLQFGGRHFRLPLFRLYAEYDAITVPKGPSELYLRAKPSFCAFVYSNLAGANQRQALLNAMNRYRKVDSGGAWLNNVGYLVPDKLAFQSKYKFAIAAENSTSPGYTTEKIVQAMAAHTIPIYWGDPLVTRDFNPKAFINCHDYPSFEAVAQRVAEIDQDDALWCEIMSEPWFRDGQEPEYLKQSSILDFFEHIFSQPLEQAYRRDRVGWGRIYGERMDCAFNHPVKHLFRRGVKRLRKLVNRG